MHVLVTGGTGTLGRALLPRLVAAGHEVRVLTRQSVPKLPTGVLPAHGDILDGLAVAQATAGVDAVVHAASNPRRNAHRIEVEGTRNVVAAAQEAMVEHLLYVSIVGIDRNPFPYYQAKRAAEAVVETAGVPWTIQRATQFFPMLDYVFATLARVPFLFPVPRGVRLQPVDVRDVADQLVAVLGEKAAGKAQDFGGPEVRGVDELGRLWAEAREHPRRVRTVPVPGKSFAAFRGGSAVCGDCATGTRTWEDYLAGG